jgi:hypothetical protein
VVTEGEFKALALWRLANHGSPVRPKFLPLGLSGVYNWRGTIGKTVGPDGSRLDVKGTIPDLDWVAWQDRKVVIAYDADAVIKAPVRIARSELAAHLRGRGALVGFLEWDLAKGKGIDDHLAVAGPDGVLDEISHVDFASSAWRTDLLRGKPMNNTEGRILPVLANAIAAFRMRLNGVACLPSTNSQSERLRSGQLPGESCRKASGRITKTGLPRNGFRSRGSSSRLTSPARPFKRQLAITRYIP